jgi:hypothetical protein
VSDPTSGVSVAGSYPGNTNAITISLGHLGSQVIHAGDRVTVSIPDVTNGPTTGAQALTVSTSSDQAATNSDAYTLTELAGPTITTTGLPGAVVGASYHQALAANGGTVPYTWSLSAGALPAGLSLNASTGTITGVPGSAGLSGFTVTVSDRDGESDAATFSIEVLAGVTTMSAEIPPAATAGQGFALSATVSGGLVTPTGTVTFSDGHGVLCTATLANGGGSCQGQEALAGTYTVTAVFPGDANFAATTATGSLAVSAVPSPVPPGASGSDTAGTAANSATVTASEGDVTAVGSGPGSVTVSTYRGNPTGLAVTGATGSYDDVAVGAGSNFSSLVVTICNVGTANDLAWFDGVIWQPFSSVTDSGNCLTATINASTSPTWSDLTGTAVALVRQAPKAVTTLSGYDQVGADGGVFVFPVGAAGGYYGSLPGLHVSVHDIVGIVPSSNDQGYFLVGADGGVFAFGDTHFAGSLPGDHVSVDDIVGIVPTADDRGYFVVGRDGGVFSFGDSTFVGSLPGIGVHVDDVVGIAATPDDRGYWVVRSTGQVFAFGDAAVLGAATGLGAPASGIEATATGGGYWVVARNGAVAAIGDATGHGSLPQLGVTPARPVVSLVPTGDDGGYWLIGADGGVFSFGDAPNVGSLPGLHVTVTDIVGAVPTLLG